MTSEYSAEELISEIEEHTEEGAWEKEETVDDGDYVRVELYTDIIEEPEFHNLGAELGVNTAVQQKSGRYTALWQK